MISLNYWSYVIFQSNSCMANLDKNSITTVAIVIFLFLLTGLTPYHYPPHISVIAQTGELACIDYDESENTILINCNASFREVVQSINDPEILESPGNGEYILNANLEVADGITFAMT